MITSHKIRNILILGLLIFNFNDASGKAYNWELLGPGDADQVTSLSILNNGDVVAGLDVGGLYISSNNGESWSPINNGLNNLDVTTKVLQDKKNLSTFFVGTRGGLFKSIDYGRNWARQSNGLPEVKKYTLSGSIGSIAVDPFNSNILYAALGYRPSSNGTITVQRMKWVKYIYKSKDGGDTWKKLPAFPEPSKVTQIYNSQVIKNTLYAATSTGLYVSKNSGQAWKRILDKNTLSITIDSNNPKIIYAACNQEGVFKTNDDGESWEELNNGLSFFNFSKKFTNRYSVITADPDNSNRLYVINSTWGRSGGLYHSEDAGLNWESISRKMPESWLKTSKRMNDVAISHINTSLIFMGSSRYIYSSTNAGKTWKQTISKKVDNGWTNTGINTFGQTRDVLVDTSDNNVMYIGTADHKLLKSTNAGKSWGLIFRGDKNASYIWDIEMCGAQPDKLLLVTTGVSKQLCIYKKSGNNKWQKTCGEFGKSNWYEKLVTSPFDCNSVFLLTKKLLYTSRDGGETWKSDYIGNKDNKLSFITFDKSEKGLAYIGSASGLFTSKNNGNTWNKIQSTNDLDITSILSDKENNTIYIGTRQSKSGHGGIYKSKNNGKEWQLTLGKIMKYVTAIVHHPVEKNIIYASTMDHNYHDLSKGSGVFKSNDSGETWTRIDLSLPIHRGYNLTTSNHKPYGLFFSSAGSGAYRLNID